MIQRIEIFFQVSTNTGIEIQLLVNVQRSIKRVYEVDAASQTSQRIHKISIQSRVRLISSKTKALA